VNLHEYDIKVSFVSFLRINSGRSFSSRQMPSTVSYLTYGSGA